jgi:alpha-1,2-mannosyltransferase
LERKFAIGVAIICLGYFALEWFNGRAQMADFRVYYDAANALLHGDVLYGKAFGVSSGFYKYSPFACIPFIPLAILPYSVASALYYLLTTGAIIFFSLRITRYLSGSKRNDTEIALPVITGIFLIDHLERELHLGNVNLLLLIALFETFILLKSNRNGKAGMLYGVILLFKPHFLLLLPYFVWKRRFAAIATTGFSLMAGLLLPSLALGWLPNLQLLLQWSTAMSDHNIALQLSPNTIYGLINRFWFSGDAGSWLVIAVLTTIAISFVGWMIIHDKREGKVLSGEVRYIEYFFLIGIVPNLVHTDTEHFMWVWPVLAIAVQAVLQTENAKRRVILTLLAFAFIPFAVNSPDIVGKRVQHIFDEGGLGLANILVLCCGIIAHYTLPSQVGKLNP